MHFCFVSTRRGSHFMTELLSALSVASTAAGHTCELAYDEYPPLRGECTYVVIPHEFHAWGHPPGFPGPQERARTIALCTENPGTEWFEATYELVAEFGAAVSINRSSAAELQRRGVRCEHLQLGYSPSWDTWSGDETAERPIDVLYLGAVDPRRDPLLAGVGSRLWARRCQFLVPPLEQRTAPRPDFLKEEKKYHRLRSAKILLNLHRTTSAALEWMRFLEAICNGCVVVSEPCLDNEPLVPGQHFLEASVESMASVVDDLLDDSERLRALRQQAYDFVRRELPMQPAGERLGELAAELPRQPPAGDESRFWTVAAMPPAEPPSAAAHAPSAPTGAAIARIGSSHTRGPAALLRGLRDRVHRRPAADVRILAQTPSYAHSGARVSVLGVIRDDCQRQGVELLESVAAASDGELEVLIHSDSEDGRTGSTLARFLADHPSLPAMLLQGGAGSGLAGARNTLAERARGEFLLILTVAGGIYPSTVARLVEAIQADSRAIFAYPMIAVLDGALPVELRGSLPWEPERLTRENWIDAIALIRRDRLLALGGYSTDPRLAGFEDYELWCKCAAAGATGVHVPQVLGWHPPSESSQPTDLEMLPPAARALMRERYPHLFDVANNA
jgi:hypothetical protein